jgi:hypothetical protein
LEFVFFGGLKKIFDERSIDVKGKRKIQFFKKLEDRFMSYYSNSVQDRHIENFLTRIENNTFGPQYVAEDEQLITDVANGVFKKNFPLCPKVTEDFKKLVLTQLEIDRTFAENNPMLPQLISENIVNAKKLQTTLDECSHKFVVLGSE